MVGVPGRSKACSTCKRRKVACDLRQPCCGPCARSKLQCAKSGGFIFVRNEAGSHKTVYKKSLNRLSTDRDHGWDSTTSKGKNEGEDVEVVPLRPPPPPPPLPKQIPALALIRQQLISTFTARSTPSDETLTLTNPYPEASMLHSWYTHLFALSNSPHDTGLSSGALACYTAFFGRRDGDASLIDASRRLYAASLGETQRALRRRETALRDETLAACLSLVTYETLECPEEGMKGYWWHSEGCLRLVELRGPKAHREGLGKVLFEEFRLHGTLDAFRRHRPNYLSSPGWMTLPFQGQAKSDTQRLLDIFLMGPEVLQKADRIGVVAPEERFPLMLNIADDLWAIDQRLEEFERDIKAVNGHHVCPIYWEEASLIGPGSEEDDDQVAAARSKSIHFASVPLARTLTFVWAIQAMIWPGLVDLYTGITSMGASVLIGDRIPVLGHRARWIELIWKICQSMEYWQSPTALAFGPVRAALQFNVVIDVLKPREGHETTLRWAEECRESIGRGWLRILRFNDDAPIVHNKDP